MPICEFDLPVHDVLVQQSNDTEDAFMVADVGEILRQHERWTANLPNVEPFYAVKCNPDPKVI